MSSSEPGSDGESSEADVEMAPGQGAAPLPAGPHATSALQTPGPVHPDRHVDVVDLTVPAQSGYVSLLRTAVAALAARLDFTLDEIDDLRIAVDEACAVLLPDAVAGSRLSCSVAVEDSDSLRVRVTGHSVSGDPPSKASFAWTVLAALAGELSVDTGTEHQLSIVMRKQRSPRQ